MSKLSDFQIIKKLGKLKYSEQNKTTWTNKE